MSLVVPRVCPEDQGRAKEEVFGKRRTNRTTLAFRFQIVEQVSKKVGNQVPKVFRKDPKFERFNVAVEDASKNKFEEHPTSKLTAVLC